MIHAISHFNTKNIVDQYNRENYFNFRYKTNFECSNTDLGMIDIQPQTIKGTNKISNNII